ncbi:MAG: hypothetical protein WCL02_07240 [bacterium]
MINSGIVLVILSGIIFSVLGTGIAVLLSVPESPPRPGFVRSVMSMSETDGVDIFSCCGSFFSSFSATEGISATHSLIIILFPITH